MASTEAESSAGFTVVKLIVATRHAECLSIRSVGRGVGENIGMAFSSPRYLAVVALAGALVLSVAGCAPEEPVAEPTQSAPPVVVSPDPVETEAPENPGTPIDLDCDSFVSPQAIYDFNSNFALTETPEVAPGSQAARALEFSGIACTWINESSGEVLTVSAANLSSDVLTEIGNTLVSSSNSVPTYDVEGYFQLVGDTGEAEVISGSYWVAATSTAFFEPGDAVPVVSAALTGLGL